jgi:hypothetical protein
MRRPAANAVSAAPLARDTARMPGIVIARRYSGEGRVGLWPREFKQDTPIMDPEYPWVASAGEDQRLFKTFRDAVDYLYMECRNTRFREPSTEEFEYDHGAG